MFESPTSRKSLPYTFRSSPWFWIVSGCWSDVGLDVVASVNALFATVTPLPDWIPSGPAQAFDESWQSSWNVLFRRVVESTPPVDPASATAASPRIPANELFWITLPWALVIRTPLLTFANATWSIVI